MFVRLTRKLADTLDGVDVSRARVGDIIQVSDEEGVALIAEGWAERPDDQAELPLRVRPLPKTGSF